MAPRFNFKSGEVIEKKRENKPGLLNTSSRKNIEVSL
jgi:hypothetical protein